MEFEKVIELLSDEREFAKVNYVPIIRNKSARYLYDFVKDNKIKNILEIGTAIGYSGCIMLSAGATNLTTIDINENYLKIAKNSFKKCGFDDKVNIIQNDAKIVIEELVNLKKHYDMIFLDGAKGQYIYYLDNLLQLIGKDGVIFADNVLLHGMVESETKIPHKKRTMVVNLRKYLDRINQKPLKTELIRIEDGIAITKYEGE